MIDLLTGVSMTNYPIGRVFQPRDDIGQLGWCDQLPCDNLSSSNDIVKSKPVPI